MPATEQLPVVSILIAARNEAHTIGHCLRAVAQLTYPPERLEVLIGNDQSTDDTAAVVQAFIAGRPPFRLVSIAPAQGHLRGKANVLAQLAQQARGQCLFFTDADTRVPPDWIESLLGADWSAANTRTPGSLPVGIWTGVTLPDGPALFHRLQAIDWLYNLTLSSWLSGQGVAVTAMGNNMAVSRRAYDAVGGYDQLPFSVVEDYALFRAVTRQGFGFRNRVSAAVLAHTEPVDTLGAWLNQRKRWMRGASQLPAWLVAGLYTQYLALPLLLLLAWVSPTWAVAIYAVHLIVQTGIIWGGLRQISRTSWWAYAFFFEGYQLVLGPLAVLYYWWPVRIRWKERTYE